MNEATRDRRTAWRPAVPLAGLTALVALAFLAVTAEPAQGVVVTAPDVSVGVHDYARLGVPGPTSCETGTAAVGVRSVASGCEGLAGCACNGWGVAYDNAVSGWCHDSVACPGGSLSLISTGAVVETQTGDLMVTHDFHPATASGRLVEATVTLENTGAALLSDVKYRRVLDWDSEPGAYSEYVTIDGAMPVPGALERSSTNGFASPDPLSSFTGTYDPLVKPCTPPAGGTIYEGPPAGAYFTDQGPCDQGTLFQFDFGDFAPGAVRSFRIYFGAAFDEADATVAVNAVDAEVWAFIQCDASTLAGYTCDPAMGTPVTYVFAFSGLDDPTADFDWSPKPACFGEPVTFTDKSTTPFWTTLQQWTWDFGDGGPVLAYGPPPPATVTHTYAGPGTYTVRLTVENSDGRDDTVEKDVLVVDCREPPVADFICLTPSRPYLRVEFFDRSTTPEGEIQAWQWQFGDGSVAPLQHPEHDYPAKGGYMVTLTVWNTEGAWDSVTKPCEARLNRPPVIDPIPTMYVYEGQQVRFQVTGMDPDLDPTYFTWDRGPLPASAAFGQAVFAWTPAKGMAGTYPMVQFIIHDFEYSDATNMTIVVRRVDEEAGPGQGDADDDGMPDQHDNCPYVPNRDQRDRDGDGIGDACQDAALPPPTTAPPVTSAVPPPPEPPLDADADGVPDTADVCPLVPDAGQEDLDGDGVGDACDPDRDGDRVHEMHNGTALDNCPFLWNPDQTDTDGDGVGDLCEGDRDSDGVPDDEDPCPEEPGLCGGVAPLASEDRSASVPTWPWLLGAGGLALAAGAVFLVARRRRQETLQAD